MPLPFFVLFHGAFAYLLVGNSAERKKDMQNEYKPTQKDTVTENVFTECSEDFILPDYMPEIRRILRLETRLLGGDSFRSGGKADFEGCVLYTLFYTDNEEKLTAVPLESRYRYELPTGAVSPLFVYSEEAVEGVHMRPSGPRRLSIRTKIRATVHTVTEEPMQKSLSELLPEGGKGAECLYKHTRIALRAHAKTESAESEAVFTLEGKDKEALRPLYAYAEPHIEKASAEGGHILFGGTVSITVLIEDGEELLTLSRRVPFEDATVADCREGDSVMAKGACHSVSLSLEQMGEDVQVRASARCALEAVCERNEELSVLSDAYLTEKALSLSYKPLTVTSFAGGFSGGFTVEGECPIEEDALVPLTCVSVKDASLSWEGKRAVVTGEGRAELLCYGKEADEEKKHFYAKDFTFPFRIEAESSEGVLPTDKKSFTLTPALAEATVQGGRAHVSCEMMLTLHAARESAYSVPESAAVLSREARASDTVAIYYPSDKDSLWSVGKAYGISPTLLAEQNGIETDEEIALDDTKSLDGIAWLFASKIS